jgi:hypothetical protein
MYSFERWRYTSNTTPGFLLNRCSDVVLFRASRLISTFVPAYFIYLFFGILYYSQNDTPNTGAAEGLADDLNFTETYLFIRSGSHHLQYQQDLFLFNPL